MLHLGSNARWNRALWLYLPVAISVALQRLRDNRVCPDPARLFINVLAKVGYVEDATPIREARISQAFSSISSTDSAILPFVHIHSKLHKRKTLRPIVGCHIIAP